MKIDLVTGKSSITICLQGHILDNVDLFRLIKRIAPVKGPKFQRGGEGCLRRLTKVQD